MTAPTAAWTSLCDYRPRPAEARATQPTPGEKHPAAQLQIMIVTELAGEHPQAPMMHVSGNEATPFAQQSAVVTVPPVEVQSSAAPAIDASPSGAPPSTIGTPSAPPSVCRPAAPTEILRSHAPPASIIPSTAHQSRFEVISGSSGAMGERVPGSLGQDVGTAEDSGKVRAAVVAAAGLDPQLATYREQLAAAGQAYFAER